MPQKPKGRVRTARGDVEFVAQQLKAAREDYEAHYGKEK